MGEINQSKIMFLTGKEWVGESGLFYFGARYYDPMIGMWTSVDPARQFASPYVYAGNGMNPMTSVDPDGMADVGLVVDVDLSPVFDGSFGVVYDTDEFLESGFFISGAFDFGKDDIGGVNLGISAGAFWMSSEIEGSSTNFDLNLPLVSPTLMFDNQNNPGLMLTGGVGTGIAVSKSNTKSYTLKTPVESFTEIIVRTISNMMPQH